MPGEKEVKGDSVCPTRAAWRGEGAGCTFGAVYREELEAMSKKTQNTSEPACMESRIPCAKWPQNPEETLEVSSPKLSLGVCPSR